MFAEEATHIPFPVKRIFVLYDVLTGQRRGGHAHRNQQQFLIMLSGGCDVMIDEGSGRRCERLDSPTHGLHVPPLVWLELAQFKP
ncbi:MAG: sugar 3,4-ketoisomerase, partial [Terriglobales bacterium]